MCHVVLETSGLILQEVHDGLKPIEVKLKDETGLPKLLTVAQKTCMEINNMHVLLLHSVMTSLQSIKSLSKVCNLPQVLEDGKAHFPHWHSPKSFSNLLIRHLSRHDVQEGASGTCYSNWLNTSSNTKTEREEGPRFSNLQFG